MPAAWTKKPSRKERPETCKTDWKNLVAKRIAANQIKSSLRVNDTVAGHATADALNCHSPALSSAVLPRAVAVILAVGRGSDQLSMLRSNARLERTPSARWPVVSKRRPARSRQHAMQLRFRPRNRNLRDRVTKVSPTGAATKRLNDQFGSGSGAIVPVTVIEEQSKGGARTSGFTRQAQALAAGLLRHRARAAAAAKKIYIFKPVNSFHHTSQRYTQRPYVSASLVFRS